MLYVLKSKTRYINTPKNLKVIESIVKKLNLIIIIDHKKLNYMLYKNIKRYKKLKYELYKNIKR